MDFLIKFAAFMVGALVTGEILALIYFIRNPDRLTAAIRMVTGLSADRHAQDRIHLDLGAGLQDHRHIMDKLNSMERKINYIGRHVKFEREQLRQMGILRDERPDVPERDANHVIELPLRRS